MTACLTSELLARYAAGDDLPPETLWVVEAHLEACAACRAALEPTSVTDAVYAAIAPRLGPGHGALWGWRHRLRRAFTRWAAPSAMPWLIVAALVPLVAMALDLIARGMNHTPSLVLLVAPVAPVFAVGASWNRFTDKAYRLVAVTARAGLALVLRRTLVALIAALPPVAVAGAVVGTSPVRWLLPGLAFTAAALALGAAVGVGRASTMLISLWTLGVVAPALSHAWPPVVLAPAGMPVWLAALALCAGVVAWQRDRYRNPTEGS